MHFSHLHPTLSSYVMCHPHPATSVNLNFTEAIKMSPYLYTVAKTTKSGEGTVNNHPPIRIFSLLSQLKNQFILKSQEVLLIDLTHTASPQKQHLIRFPLYFACFIPAKNTADKPSLFPFLCFSTETHLASFSSLCIWWMGMDTSGLSHTLKIFMPWGGLLEWEGWVCTACVLGRCVEWTEATAISSHLALLSTNIELAWLAICSKFIQ